jgi:hypothetical protein
MKHEACVDGLGCESLNNELAVDAEERCFVSKEENERKQAN